MQDRQSEHKKNTMDLNKLNNLIEKVRSIDTFKATARKKEELEGCLKEIKLNYGSFLLDKLFDIYDSHFSENVMMALESYIMPEGVQVDGVFEGGSALQLKLKPYPLRFELEARTQDFRSIIWSAA